MRMNMSGKSPGPVLETDEDKSCATNVKTGHAKDLPPVL